MEPATYICVPTRNEAQNPLRDQATFQLSHPTRGKPKLLKITFLLDNTFSVPQRVSYKPHFIGHQNRRWETLREDFQAARTTDRDHLVSAPRFAGRKQGSREGCDSSKVTWLLSG